MVIGLAACSSASGAAEVRSDAPRATTSGATAAPAVAGVNGLAADLYALLATTPGNLVFSPYSVEVALAMARNGAVGETRTQMDTVLRAGAGSELDQALNVLDQELARRSAHHDDGGGRKGDVSVEAANALFGQKDTEFEDVFLDSLATYYGAGMRVVDYKRAAEAARQDINTWAEEETNGKIVDLLPEGSIDSLTRLVVANAIYFKAPWMKRFEPLGPRPFATGVGTTISADAMHVSSPGGAYRSGPGWELGEIPYLGGELSMVVVVPDDLAAFEAQLDGATLDAILSSTDTDTDTGGVLTSLQMPKFTFRTAVDLGTQLAALGMPLAFTDGADFSGITQAEVLRIDEVAHQAFIAVDEEGTEAAAATAVKFEAVGAPIGGDLVVDKPFLFAVRDNATGTILFLGRVTDPTAE